MYIENFFTVTHYQHKELFATGYVWHPLRKLKEYVHSLKLGRIEVEIPPGVTLINKEAISIGPGTVVEAGAYIQGPCFIGKKCQIRQGAYIRGDVITGDECIIGHTTEIKHSILLHHAYAAHFAYVGDSILGNNTNLGAGVKCANLRFDGESVAVKIDGKLLSTGLRKFGAIIGDCAQIGCNTVLNPGTCVGRNTYICPALAVHGFIPSNSIVREEQKYIVQARIL